MPWNSGVSSAAPGGCDAERVELHGEMPVLPDRIDERRGARRLAEQRADPPRRRTRRR